MVNKMWYAILKREQEGFPFKAGTVFAVKKVQNEICATKIDLNNFKEIPFVSYIMTVEAAKNYFTKPSDDKNSIIEESFMICEREYC